MPLFHRNVVVFQFAFKKGTKIDDLISFYSDKYSFQANYLAIYGKKKAKNTKKQVFSICGRGQVTITPNFRFFVKVQTFFE